jgi:hypothetical protein
MSDAEQSPALAAVMARLERLERERAESTREIARLRRQIEMLVPPSDPSHGAERRAGAATEQAATRGRPTSRRRLLRVALGAAAATAGTAAALGTRTGTALADTTFSSNGATGGQAAVIASGTNGANAVNALGDSGAGVKASSTSGPAVTANSVTGTGLSASSDAGAGIMTSSTAGAALHAVAGTPQSGTTGVRAAVVADGGSASGVYATSVTDSALVGVGVVGASGLGQRSGLAGFSVRGYGVSAQGGLAPLYLKPAATAGRPTSGAHQQGELYADSTGALFYCVASGRPGTWKRVTLV